MMHLLLNSLIFSLILCTDWSISQDIDRLCPPATCPDSPLRFGYRTTGLPYCRCDNQCGDYGDCCLDAPNKTKTTNETLYTCTTFPRNSYFVKRVCLTDHYKNKSKCALSNNYDDHISQMHLKIPVTSKLNKNITYGNIFCAFCDNETSKTLTYWNLQVTCGSQWSKVITNITFDGPNTFLKNQPELKKLLIFANDTKTWTFVNGSVKANCSMEPRLPFSLRKVVRTCVPLNSTCPANFLVTNITDKCAEFQSVVHSKGGAYYRNAHCALCNGVPTRNLTCYLPPPKSPTPRYVWRSTKPPNPEVMPRKRRTYLYLAMKSDCANLLSRVELTKVKAETVIYRSMNRTFIRNTTVINGAGIQVCHIDNETVNEFVESEVNSTFFRLVVNVGCLGACTFLLLHIWNYVASTEDCRRLSQRLSLSLAAALLLGNVGFLYESVSQVAVSAHLIVCAIDSCVTYYGFLASFLWISSMAFDISCSVWGFAFDEANALAKSQAALFVVYSAASWALPAVVSVCLFWYKRTADGTQYSCLLTDEATLLWCFVLPLTVCMSVNLAFYLCTVFVVLTEEKVVGKMLEAGIEFKSHTCLIVLTNVMWLTIVLAGYLASHALIVLFVACDVLLSFVLYWLPVGKDARVTSKVASNNHSVTVPQSDTQ